MPLASWYKVFADIPLHTAQKIKFSIKDFFSKYDQIGWKLRIWSHILKKSLMQNFIFCPLTLVKGLVLSYMSTTNLSIISRPFFKIPISSS